MGLNVSFYIYFLSYVLSTYRHVLRRWDLSEPKECFFYKWFTFSIKMSCDICDAWPATNTGGSAVPQGAKQGPRALT